MHNKTKIGIITFHRSENYGSALQAYALQSYLLKCGFDVKIIDYHNIEQDKIYQIFKPIRSLKSVWTFLYTLLYLPLLKEKKKKYKIFQTIYFFLTPEYTGLNQLEHINGMFDYFIAGSDQIWNISCSDFTEAYFLSFVKDKRKCISYAPSINKFSLNGSDKEFFVKYLSDFKSISCREKDGVKLLNSMLHRTVDLVPDPVFFWGKDFWLDMISDVSKPYKNFFFCYFIGNKKEYREKVNQLARKYKLKPVLVNFASRDVICRNAIKEYEVGPKEFLSLLYNSDFIVTNSFHALAFSIIFKKKILNLDCTDSRRLSALKTIYPTVKFDTDQIIDFAEYSDVCELDKYVQKGKDFLADSLKD